MTLHTHTYVHTNTHFTALSPWRKDGMQMSQNNAYKWGSQTLAQISPNQKHRVNGEDHPLNLRGSQLTFSDPHCIAYRLLPELSLQGTSGELRLWPQWAVDFRCLSRVEHGSHWQRSGTIECVLSSTFNAS